MPPMISELVVGATVELLMTSELVIRADIEQLMKTD